MLFQDAKARLCFRLAATDGIGYNLDGMTELFQIVVLRVGVALLAMLAVVSVLAGLLCAGRHVTRRLRTLALAAMSFVAIVATVLAQKGDRGAGTGDPPAGEQQTGTTGDPPVEDITDKFHFSAISVPTNGTVALATAWTNGLLAAGQTIDILAKTDLRDETWTWLTNGVVEAGATNMSWTIGNQSPSNSFYRAVVRDTLTDMDDPDGDGLPNAYELAHGRNPWVRDYALVQKLTVGPNGEFGDIFSALSASEAYSVVALTSGVHQVNYDIQMPEHPVMVTCEDGYAVLGGSTSIAIFLLGSGHGSGHTLFRNLYLNLASAGGMQAGFWCGGGLPWEGPGAAAVFENVHIRAPNPGVEYFGWLFYGHCEAPAVIRGCCVNASGAEWIYAILDDNPPPIVVESCTFVNFPTQSVYQSTAIGLRSTHASGTITSTPPVMLSRVLFDASFTNAWPMVRFENASGFPVTMTDCIRPSEPTSPDFMPSVTGNVHIVTSQVAWAGFPLADSPAAMLGIGAFAPIPSDSLDDTDHDTLLDYNEVYVRDLDPFLADTDGDGTDDGDEIHDGTDPSDPHFFLQRLTVAATNTASLSYPIRVAWGTSSAGWETNGLAVFPQGFGAKVYTNEVSQVTRYARAFCDFNGNGEYDADNDILLVRSIPHVGTARIDFVFGDVDRDGLSDYDEIYTHGTNPLRRDTDGDGASDGDEVFEGTDPTNRHSFVQTLYVSVTNTASLAHSIHLAWGYSDTGWETNGLAMFPQGFGTNTYDDASPQGAAYVKAFCDLNGNGEYDAEYDILLVHPIPFGRTAQVSLAFGDVDGDGVPDVQERQEQTDPNDANNFRLVATVNFVPCGVTSWLTNYVAWGYVDSGWETNDLASFNGTNLLFDIDVPVTNGELYVKVFRDLNTNGVYDAEADALKIWKLTGTDRGKTVTLNFGDEDNNELPDWWEAQEGLEAEGMARRAYDDPDGDGLINLHEYWCGTHPLVPDGSNTLLSVASRSIDDRIRDIDPVTAIPRFVNYFVNGSNEVFQLNTNFWARDLDLSCVSVWHNGEYPGSKAATLITRRHVVMAKHWATDTYKFCDTNGVVLTRTIAMRSNISDDLQLGRLDEPLPTSFKPASVPTTNIVRFLSTGRYMPTLCLNHEKGGSVSELVALDCETISDRGIHYQHYGCTSQTNLVSVQRCSVRGATVDGTSGCPVFVVVGNELVLLFSKHLGQKNGETWQRYWGPMLPFRLDAIQHKIDQWEGDGASQYQIETLDLSSFGEIVNQQ